MNYRMLAATALVCGTIGGAALAQQEEGQVLVDLVNIQADIAQELGVDAAQVPMTVMVPVSVAAQACGLDESTLEQNSVGSTDSGGSGDAASGDASGDAAAGDAASGDAAATAGVDTDGGDAAQGCIASASSPELTQAVQAEMSGTATP